jgi:hypothetical protein
MADNTRTQPSAPSWDVASLVVAEYTQLREEIIKLAELQFQIVALTVVTFGTVLSVGFQFSSPATVLVYPLLSLIFVILWLHHAHRIVRIATYTRQQLEQRAGLDNLGWEHHVQSHPLPLRHFAYWGIRSIFVATALVASVEGAVMVHSFSLRADALICVSVLASLGTAATTWFWREPSPELNGPVHAAGPGSGSPAAGI